jgi:hypothetical protein
MVYRKGELSKWIDAGRTKWRFRRVAASATSTSPSFCEGRSLWTRAATLIGRNDISRERGFGRTLGHLIDARMALVAIRCGSTHQPIP